MAKVPAESIHAIMTGQTIGAERRNVSLGKGIVHLAVAIFAGFPGKLCDVILVTILAGERSA